MRGGGGGGQLLIWVVLFLLLTGAKCSLSTQLACAEETSKCNNPAKEYPRVGLTLDGISAETYMAFIQQLRDIVAASESHGVPVCRSRAGVRPEERFVLVDITNLAGEVANLAIDVTDVYVVGYGVGTSAFLLRPDNDDVARAIGHLFPGSSRRTELPFTGSYGDLKRQAVLPEEANVTYIRLYLGLGPTSLGTAVTSLNRYARTPTPMILHAVARALIVCIQMVSEAARFRAIEIAMSRRISEYLDYAPGHSIVSLENEWGAMSTAVQETSNGGRLSRAVTLLANNGEPYEVTEMIRALSIIALMKYVCNAPKKPSIPGSVLRLATLSSSLDDDPICPDDFEPKVRILGADGLCVDVKDGYYNNGNPIQLWPCKSNGDQNQLWTFNKDGTLQSDGKCLASYGHTPGDYIMIYECRPSVDEFIWRVLDNGTILSRTGLVLAAPSSASGTVLTAQLSVYTTGQSWLPTNTTQPPVQQIAAISGLCLHADGDDVLLRDYSDKEEQSWWALYPDSSIRPNKQRKSCIAAPSFAPQQPLKIVSCNSTSYLQRWLFATDGTIINLYSEFVMDVSSSGDHVILNIPMGTPAQQWQALL